MRVLIVSHMFPSNLDTTNGIFVELHVEALRKAGVDARVVAPVPWAPRLLWFNERWRRYGQVLRREEWKGIPVRRVPYLEIPGQRYRLYAGHAMATALKPVLREIRREFPFDLIHSHALTPDGYATIPLAMEHGVPSLCSVLGCDLNNYPYTHPKRMEDTLRVLRETSRIICVSGALAEEARKVTEGAIQPDVIYMGVDQRRFHPIEDKMALRRKLDLPIDRPLLLFVGRLEREKGVAELFSAFKGLKTRHPNLQLVCLGDGSFRRQFLAQVEQAGLQDFVSSPGNVTQDIVGATMQACDLFTLPTYFEGMPNVLLEAMSCGLPSVASRVGGIPEVLQHGHNGLLIDPKDATGLEQALDVLVADSSMREQFGQVARAVIQDRFSWEANARAHLEAYQGVLSA